eukprot:CAMPEP_0184424976 /NCGR_PEP_ID=MMETSP0738-20130409/122453_1 /TAXON_ID=385413 /ORGANISM="Thalassiosira miniscula, Strain CCMP1093" /LENGTH=53 /DNA_ID=CAMNT_0026787655 /DNA_START=53 /DNA_END=211 /DNA_ORIENTATION=+
MEDKGFVFALQENDAFYAQQVVSTHIHQGPKPGEKHLVSNWLIQNNGHRADAI